MLEHTFGDNLYCIFYVTEVKLHKVLQNQYQWGAIFTKQKYFKIMKGINSNGNSIYALNDLNIILAQ